MEKTTSLLQQYDIPFEENVSLKEKTWIKTGGVASLWIIPLTVDQLKSTLEILSSNNQSYEIVGHTSNLYYRDEYNPSIIISTKNVKGFVDKSDYIECCCGTPVTLLAKYCVDKGYQGYYGLVNLPGTVGAAICNSSSCFDCSIAEHVIDVTFFNSQSGKLETLTKDDIQFSYRNSNFKSGVLQGVILTASLSKCVGVIEQEKEKAEQVTNTRRITQEPPAYTLGSVYAGLTARRSLKSYLVAGGGKLLKFCGLYTKKRYIRLCLFVFGYGDLKEFVSTKVINCFKWLPDRPDKHKKFVRYQSFINSAFVEPRLEIEIRKGE